MLNNMVQKEQESPTDRVKEVSRTYDRDIVSGLLESFKEALLSTPEFQKETARVRLNDDGKPKIQADGIEFKRGNDLFVLTTSWVTPENNLFMLSVSDITNGNEWPQKVVVLCLRKQDGEGTLRDSFIRYGERRFPLDASNEHVNNAEAVGGAQDILARLKARGEPLIGSVT